METIVARVPGHFSTYKSEDSCPFKRWQVGRQNSGHNEFDEDWANSIVTSATHSSVLESHSPHSSCLGALVQWWYHWCWHRGPGWTALSPKPIHQTGSIGHFRLWIRQRWAQGRWDETWPVRSAWGEGPSIAQFSAWWTASWGSSTGSRSCNCRWNVVPWTREGQFRNQESREETSQEHGTSPSCWTQEVVGIERSQKWFNLHCNWQASLWELRKDQTIATSQSCRNSVKSGFHAVWWRHSNGHLLSTWSDRKDLHSAWVHLWINAPAPSWDHSRSDTAISNWLLGRYLV